MGKLSMKDIMNLFRREAEHEHGGKELGEKTRILSPGGGRNGSGSGAGTERTGKRETPPFMEKGRNGVREDAVFGRRW